jgi:GT2 family glycosyltransferase
MAKILFITVNFRRPDLTIALMNNLAKMNCSQEIDLIIADNTPEEELGQELDCYVSGARGLSVQLIKTGKNLGYFGAADFVLNRLNNFMAEYQAVIIANNDIEIKDPHFFNKLFPLLPRAAVIAPDIISTITRRHQNPHRLTSISWSQKAQYRVFFLNFFSGWALFHARRTLKFLWGFLKSPQVTSECEIYSAHGSFMIFSRKFFLEGGTIDSGYFLYGEEDSVAAQCVALGLTILYCPALVVYHNEHQTTGGNGFKKNIFYQQKKAFSYIRANYPNFY